MSKSKRIILWVVSILLTAVFLFAGGFKLLKAHDAIAAFGEFGLPGRLAIFIGVCEVCGAIGLLIPRLAGLAASGLSVIMLGATILTARIHNIPVAISNAVIFVLLIAVARARFTSGRSLSPPA